MNLPTLLLAPALLTVATVTYVVAGPARQAPRNTSAEVATPSPTPSTDASAPTSSPASTATPDVPDTLPPGLSGRLTYRTGRELVTVQFPDATELSRAPSVAAPSDSASADGTWRAHRACAGGDSGATGACHLELISAAGDTRSVDVDVDPSWPHGLQWSPVGHALALMIPGDDGSRLAVIGDPTSDGPRVLSPGPNVHVTFVTDFAWMAGGRSLLVAQSDGVGSALFQTDVATGDEEPVAKLAELPNFLYPSPDRTQFAFTGSAGDGWHLYLFDPARPFDVRDLGPMGSDGPGATPVPSVPDVKSPIYVAWSPDSTRLAFGGGFNPPYIMKTVDIATGSVLTTQFPEGYPGEIKWSPDGTRIAVSTYNIPRTHHESYVVDPATGAARDVLSGCVIVWSPDSRFLAIHGERQPGVAIADIVTLQQAQLTHVPGDTPLEWTP